jgi:hypothetical protein
VFRRFIQILIPPVIFKLNTLSNLEQPPITSRQYP